MKVEELMTKQVATLPPTATLKEAAALMVERRISGVPVVDGGRVVGILSEHDLLVKERGPSDGSRWLRWLADARSPAERPKLEAHTVGEAMTTPPLTIAPQSDVSVAARRMLEAGIGRLPVTGDGTPGGRLVGIVTRADLVRAFTRTDAAIEREIREDVVTRRLWLEQGSVVVEVHDGEVSLSGRVRDRFDADLLARLVGRVPGVVGIDSHVEIV